MPNWRKYRKRPVVIEAYQTDKEMEIKTLEGTMKANVGDWIIKGVNGELYPCKPDIFAKTYEEEEMTNQEVINVLDGIYNNPTASKEIKEACIVAMEAVDIKNSVERITTGLQISSAESKAKDTMTNAEAIKTIKSIVETLDDYSFYTEEDKVAFGLAIKALEREEGCRNKYGLMIGFHCSGCGNSWEENAHDFNYCPNCGRRVEK